MRRIKFDTMVTFRNLLVKQISKDRKKPLKTAKDVLLLVDAILYDYKVLSVFMILAIM